MLFLKTEGCTLSLDDWKSQAQAGDIDTIPADFLASAASAMWFAISQRGVSWDSALHEIEKRVLQAAMNVDGCTRRELAERLQTSERTLYHKMRAYGLGRSDATDGSRAATATSGSF